MKKNSKKLNPEKSYDTWQEIVLTDSQIELLNLQNQFFDGEYWYIFLVPSIIKVGGDDKFYITDKYSNLNDKTYSWFKSVLRAYLYDKR